LPAGRAPGCWRIGVKGAGIVEKEEERRKEEGERAGRTKGKRKKGERPESRGGRIPGGPEFNNENLFPGIAIDLDRISLDEMKSRYFRALASSCHCGTGGRGKGREGKGEKDAKKMERGGRWEEERLEDERRGKEKRGEERRREEKRGEERRREEKRGEEMIQEKEEEKFQLFFQSTGFIWSACFSRFFLFFLEFFRANRFGFSFSFFLYKNVEAQGKRKNRDKAQTKNN